MGHGEGVFAKEIIPKAGAGHCHFDEAGHDGEGEIPEGKFLKIDQDEDDSDDPVEEKPEGGVE